MSSLNIFKIPKATTQDFNGGPFYGFRVLKGGVAATIAVDDNAADPLFAGCEFHPNLKPWWRKLSVASDPNVDTLLELQTDKGIPFSGNIIAPNSNVDANGTQQVGLYDSAGRAISSYTVGGPVALETMCCAVQQPGGAVGILSVDVNGGLIQSNKAVQIWQTALVLADANAAATYFSSTGVKGTTAIAGYDLSAYRALMLVLNVLSYAGGTSIGAVLQYMQDGVITTPANFQAFATAVSAVGMQTLWLNRDGPEVASAANPAGVAVGTNAVYNRPWAFLRAVLGGAGVFTTFTGTLTLYGING